MEAITLIVEKMLEPIIEASCTSIGRQFGYWIHCKKSINEFEDEVDKLSLVKERIQTSVDSALQNAEDIHNEVLEWQRKVQSMEDDRSRLLQGKENLKCVDVCSRYRLGKEGKNKKTVVTRLIEDGNNFGTVGHRPPLTHIWHRTYSIKYENFDSRELVFNQIMEAIKDDTNYKIGIHGMPGAGKTRMMKEVAQQAEKERLFDEIVEIVVTQNPNLKDLQQKLAEGLNLDLNKETEDARKGLLRERMLKNGKKILVMVDDVWDDQIKLEDIGIPARNDHKMGCKILLTSRRQDVCKAMGVEKEFSIGLLSDFEAWSLFEKKVGDSIEGPEMRSVAEAVCRECAGLPLAILVVGGALLLNKSKQVWEDALEQQRNSSGENIAGLSAKLYSRIELSYNHLEHVDAKSIFLLCPLFGEDAEISIDDLVSYGFGMRLLRGVDTMKKARNRSRVIVDTLKISSLLLEGTNENFVKMHDVIRDVAISIASKKEDAMFLVKAGVEKWPEEDEYKGCRAISLRLNKDCVLPNDLECPELRTLMLEGMYDAPSEVPSSFFDGMEKLEVLCLRYMHISTLPSSLKNLRMLGLYNCRLVNLAFLKELRKLEILTIQDFDLKKLAPEIRQLDCLRLLDLKGYGNLEILPSGVISSLSQLEELYIGESFDRWEVEGNASLMEINSLTHLISLEVYVPNVMLLPLNELLFKSLIRFRISIGRRIISIRRRRIPLDISLSATRILKLEGIPYNKELNILMEKAEVVSFFKVKGLKNAFDDVYGEGFQDLEYLRVKGCDDIFLEHLFHKPKSISQTRGPCVSGSFSKLSVLKIDHCQLRYLFSTTIARGLAKLQELKIKGCEVLEEIIRDDQEVIEPIIFHGLKKMRLEGLPNLRSFYFNMKNMSTLTQALFNDKVAFPALEELIIYGLKRPTAIWDGQSQSFQAKAAEDSFRSLRCMEVTACNELLNVIPSNMLPRLQNLEELEVVECDSVLSKVEVLGTVEKGSSTSTPTIVLPRIQRMFLLYLPNLMHMKLNRKEHSLDRLCAYSHLTSLEIWSCDSLRNLFSPSTARCLVHLQRLIVCECEKMEEIVAVEMGQLGEDGEEDLVHDEIIVFPQLNYIQFQILPNLKSFCCYTRGSKKQGEETMELNIPRVDALFNHKVAFPVLEELHIEILKRLTAIWDDQSQSFLVKEAEDSFRSLRSMKVAGCSKLMNVIPSNMLPRLQNLEGLQVHGCDSVEVFGTVEKGSSTSTPTIVLLRLQQMPLSGLPNLMMLNRNEHSAGRFCAYSHLISLEILNCDSLTNIFSPSTARCLVHLQELIVCYCEEMKEIVAVEMRQLGEEDLVHDEIIVFRQLKRIKFGNLPNLRSFCCSIVVSKKQGEETVELNIPRVDAIFNHKIAFPALEVLCINNLKRPRAIWDDQSESFLAKEAQDSFRSLRSMEVSECSKLVNVIPSNMLPRLQNLKELVVSQCNSVFSKVEVLGTVEKGSSTSTPTIVLPRLRRMFLIGLPSLVYMKLNWKKHSAGRLCAYSHLTSLVISYCDSLGNVFSPSTARCLVHLRELTVFNCEKIEEIVAVKMRRFGEEDLVHGEIIVFPQLKYIKFRNLPNLLSFCCCNRGSKKQGEETVKLNIPRVDALFNHKVRFPALLKLDIYGLKMIKAIWDNELSQGLEVQDFFPQLRLVTGECFEKLKNDIPPNALPWLQKLEIREF